MTNCTNCGIALTGKFCSNCGQKKFSPHDLTISKFILNFFEDFFKFDSNVFRSLQELLLKPGYLSLEYIKGRIASHVKPLKFFIFICIVVFFIGKLVSQNDYSFALEDLDFMKSKIELVTTKNGISKDIFIEKFNSNYFSKLPFFYLIAIIVFTILLSILFIKQKRVVAEHLVFSLHFYTACLVFSLMDSLLDSFFGAAYYIFFFIVPFFYLIIAIRNYYTKNIFSLIFSSLLMYVFYFLIQYYWIILTANLTVSFL